MNYSVLFVLLAGALAFLALDLGGAAWLLCWPVANCLAIAAGYGVIGASVFGKASDGSLPLISKVFFAPYFLATWSTWHVARVVSSENAYDEISTNLVVGRRLLAQEYSQELGLVVDLTCEFSEDRLLTSKTEYIAFPILDASTPEAEPLLKLLAEIGDRRVFIHCAQGHGRTGTVASLLMLYRGEAGSIERALERLQGCRPGLRLNSKQMTFVKRIEARVVRSRLSSSRL